MMLKTLKNNGPKFMQSKNINLGSFKLNLILDLLIRQKESIKKGIKIRICLIINIDGCKR